MHVPATAQRIAVPTGASLSTFLCRPAHPSCALVLAHGAGAGMTHPFMEDLSQALAQHSVATLRFQFPFMEAGSKRPDRPAVAQVAVRAAVAAAATQWPGLPLFAGGKSFGARMSSQAQAEQALQGVRGLVFVGFPLHPAGQPSTRRAEHLQQVQLPMLFLQGTRDALADLGLIEQTVATLQPRARLQVIAGADHAFHVLVRSGRRDADVILELAQAVAAWTSAQAN